jgi:ATP-dependent exoDNAse (exonuclease V) alpha subunit
VLVLADASAGAERIHRGDGRSAPIPVESRRYTTPDMVRTERNLIQMAQHRRGAGAGLAAPLHIDAAITARPTLSDEQEVMVRRICTSGDGVEVVPGVAGSGKTYALAAAREAWQASGRTVVGAALAAQAARQLETGSGIPSSTIARLDADLDGPDSGGLGPDHVLVIDEAAMVGTRSLVRLIAHAHRGGAKVVLIGDACQLPEIEAGGAFAGLDRRSDPARLSANRRQHAPWECQALADLRLGHAAEALDAYLDHDRIHHHADQSSAEMVGEWWSAHQDGHEVLMLASRHEVVTDLNRQARSRMAAEGLLHGPEVNLGGRAFQEGDEVLGLKNDYRAQVLNGTRGTVDAIDQDAETIRVTTSDGIAVEVPFDYARQGHLTHGYAMTVHKAQGATVDTALVLADATMTREGIYTAMSRGRASNHLYLAGDDARADIAHAPEITRDQLDALLANVETSAAQELAIERGPISR